MKSSHNNGEVVYMWKEPTELSKDNFRNKNLNQRRDFKDVQDLKSTKRRKLKPITV